MILVERIVMGSGSILQIDSKLIERSNQGVIHVEKRILLKKGEQVESNVRWLSASEDDLGLYDQV